MVVSAGKSGDSPMLPVLLGHLTVPRIGPGRPRTTPDRLRATLLFLPRAPLVAAGAGDPHQPSEGSRTHSGV